MLLFTKMRLRKYYAMLLFLSGTCQSPSLNNNKKETVITPATQTKLMMILVFKHYDN